MNLNTDRKIADDLLVQLYGGMGEDGSPMKMDPRAVLDLLRRNLVDGLPPAPGSRAQFNLEINEAGIEEAKRIVARRRAKREKADAD